MTFYFWLITIFNIFFSHDEENDNIIEIRCKEHYKRHITIQDTNMCTHGGGLNQCGKLACYKVSNSVKSLNTCTGN